MSRSKRYLEAKKQVERLKEYSLDEAVELLKKVASSKFDETI